MPGLRVRSLLASLYLATVGLALAGGRAAADAPLPASVVAPVPARPSPSPLPEGWQHGAFAEIYVRAYRDSDGDGIGDLKGLTSQLDYLRDLGVRGLWLMPVTRSGDHDHGYAVEDYRDIEPAYGTLADFDELLRQAHARGIGVIVDYVINHSAATNPVFLAGARDRASPYRRWYLWRDPAPTDWKVFDHDPWVRTPEGTYFAQFSKSMPDFNLQAPGVMDWHADNERFWLNRGVDGFRFDAVAHLVENGKDAWYEQPQNIPLAHAATQVALSYPHRYVVCESPRENARYATADACGSAFAFDLGHVAIAAARGDAVAIEKLSKYFESAAPGIATMLSNHDLFAGDRLWNQLGGNLAQYRLAAASYLLAPGTPFIYYGEELGMASVDSLKGDAKLRAPMSWNAEKGAAGFSSGKPFRPLSPNAADHNVDIEQKNTDSLLSWYRGLLEVRNSVPALARGRYEGARAQGQVWSHRRVFEGQTAVVLFNYGAEATRVELEGLAPGTTLDARLPGSTKTLGVDTDGRAALTLPPQSVQVFVAGKAN